MDRSKVSDTTNINWPLYHVALRIAIAHILKNDRLRNVRCTAAQLIPILHSLAGVQEGIDDREKVTVDIIKTAFSRMSEHYTVPYSKIGIEGTTNESLIVRNGCRSGSSRRDSRERANDFCYINDISNEVNDIAVESEHPLNNAEIQRAISIPENVLQRLIAYLKEQKKNKNKNKKGGQKRRASDPGASRGDGTQSNTRRKRGGSVTSTGTDVTQDDVTDPEAAAIRDFFKDTHGELSLMYVIKSRTGNHKFNLPNTDEFDCDTPIISLRHLFRGLSSPMNKTKSKLDEDAEEEEEEDDNVEEDDDNDDDKEEDEMVADTGENEEKENKRKYERRYRMENYGTSHYWVPNGVIATTSQYYSKLCESHKAMTKFLKLFKGKYCRIKDKAFKTFVLGSISGYGCSDEAAILMLCCTLKLVLITMGIDHKISDEQIANAGPCRNKITNGEYMIAAGCVQESRHDMEINGVTTVSVSSDHDDLLIKLLTK